MNVRSLAFAAAIASAVGCSSSSGPGNSNCTSPGTQSCPATTPSYAKDVAPVISTYCVGCHAASASEGDKPLNSYQALKARASEVRGQLEGCEMPPSGETQPSDAQKKLVLSWIACGAPNN
jgi:uncharacterized membrane protein